MKNPWEPSNRGESHLRDKTCEAPRGLSIIAVDGARGVGKSMLAAGLRDRFGCGVLDVGPVFRVVAWLLDRRPEAGEDAALEVFKGELSRGNLKIRMDAGCRMAASRIEYGGVLVEEPLWDSRLNGLLRRTAGSPHVIAEVKKIARDLANGDRCVVVGREVGTYFFPDAALKLVLEAHSGVRTERKVQQLSQVMPDLGEPHLSASHSEPNRAWSIADDVIRVDTTLLTPGELLARVSHLASDRLGWIEIRTSLYE